MAAAFVSAVGYLIASNAGTPTPSTKKPPAPVPGPALWPYVLCGAMFVVGALVYGAAHGMLPWQTRRALKRRAETAESERDEARRERDEARRELEDGQRAAISAPAEPGPLPFDLRYYTRPAPEYGGWVTSHYIAIEHPPGQPERRVYVIQDDMKPEPRFRSPQGPGRPGFPYFVPPAGGGDGGAGVLIRPGQEESWFLGYTGTGGAEGNEQMSVFEFNVTNHAKLYWQLYPDESWRFSYHVKCDGVESEMPFSIVVDSLDGKTIRVRQQG